MDDFDQFFGINFAIQGVFGRNLGADDETCFRKVRYEFFYCLVVIVFLMLCFGCLMSDVIFGGLIGHLSYSLGYEDIFGIGHSYRNNLPFTTYSFGVLEYDDINFG